MRHHIMKEEKILFPHKHVYFENNILFLKAIELENQLR